MGPDAIGRTAGLLVALHAHSAFAGGGIGVVCSETENPSHCQLPDQMNHGAGGIFGASSDAAAGYAAAERVTSDAGASIATICWWGFYVDFVVPDDCGSPAPTDDFTITVFADTAGCPVGPDTGQPVGPFSVAVTRAATGNVISAVGTVFIEYEYTATLPAPVAMGPGECAWIQILNDTSATPQPDCFWLWSTAPGDGVSWQSGGGGLNDFDLAICVEFELGEPLNCAANPLCVGAMGDCAEVHGTPGCNDECCCVLVCEQDPSCCETEWSQLCVDAAVHAS